MDIALMIISCQDKGEAMVLLKDKVLALAEEDMVGIEEEVDHAGSKTKKGLSVVCFLEGICHIVKKILQRGKHDTD